MTASVYPALFLVVVVVCLVFYRISRSLDAQIQDELAARRAKFAATTPTLVTGQA